jgi:hypothetical protein
MNPLASARRTLVSACAGLFTLAALCSPAARSSAQPRGGGVPQEPLIDQGLQARRDGNDEQALALFTQAWERSRSPRARAQIGLAEQALGHFADAETHLREALGATNDPWVRERRAALEEAIAAVGARLGTLDLRCNVPDAVVRIDGREIVRLPLVAPLRLEPGVLTVEVRAVGYVPITRSVTVEARGLSRQSFELAREEAPAPGSRAGGAAIGATIDAPPPPDPGATYRTLAYLSFGIGGAALITGIVSQVVREGAVQSINDSPSCTRVRGVVVGGGSRCFDLQNRLDLTSSLLIGGYVGAGVLAVTGLVLLLTAPGAESAASPQSAAAHCGPTLGEIGVMCVGRF